MKSIGRALTGLSALLLVACQPTSTGIPNQLAVKARIKQNGEKYSQLSSAQKAAVGKGSLSKGMKKDAVRIAWGKPDKTQQSSSPGGKKELWIYYTREQVDFDDQSPYGTFGRLYRRSDKFYDAFSNSDLRTVQRVGRAVSFFNGRVVAWTGTRN